MSIRQFAVQALVAVLLLLTSSIQSHADDFGSLIPAGGCNKDSYGSGMTSARALSRPIKFPQEGEKEVTEGWVALHFAVNRAGVPGNFEVIDSVGPAYFVQTALNAVGQWRFTPAMRRGAVIDQDLYRLLFTFRFPGVSRLPDHSAFVDDHNRATRLLRENNPDEAIAIMDKAMRNRVTLYEAARGSLLLAIAHVAKGRSVAALAHARRALIESGVFLEPRTLSSAYLMLMRLEASAGHHVRALCAYKDMKDVKVTPADASAAALLVADIERVLKSDAPIVTEIELSGVTGTNGLTTWRHDLVRKKFAITNLNGNVARFRLRCFATTFEQQVDPEMEWSVPDDAGACVVAVEGSPGARFTFVESRQ
jgi:TonB family protein